MRYDAKFKLAAVREVLVGVPIAKVARKYKVSRQSLHLWLARYRSSQVPSSLRSKYVKGKTHPKSLSWNTKRAILDMVVRSPQLGVHGITRELRRQGILVSTFGVWRTLERHNLQVRELREQLSQKVAGKTAFANRVGTSARIEAVREYLSGGKSVSSICRKFLVTRKTFYSWLSRYRHGPDDKFEALRRMYRRGYEHPQCKTGHLRERILEIVAHDPQLSVHRLHSLCEETLGKSAISHQALQNLLVREGLNTYDLRMAYARGRAEQSGVLPAPLYVPQMPMYRLRMLLSPFVTIPKLLVTNPKKGIWYLVPGSLFFSIFVLWLRLLATAPQGTSTLGMVFASIALTFGFVFFVYSIKYYFAVILVLRLAQARARGPTPISTDQKPINADSNVNDQRSTILNILRAIPFVGRVEKFLSSSRLRSNNNQSRVNPLLVDLEKVELTEKPFVSIHVAVYNEKKVVERLIRACTAQEWHCEKGTTSGQGTTSTTSYKDQARDTRDTLDSRGTLANYEVVIADDSTDETMEIAKEVLLSMDYSVARERYDEQMEIFRFDPPPDFPLPIVKIIHRFARSGFKGGALYEALKNADARAEYIMVLDADFVPYPDTIEQFVKTFQVLNANQDEKSTSHDVIMEGENRPIRELVSRKLEIGSRTSNAGDSIASLQNDKGGNQNDKGGNQNDKRGLGSQIAAVQGYQWHVLNKSQNWVTRGVRTEYAGSYVIERSSEEIYQGLKQIAGSVYMIRSDILRKFGWGTSITEDFELTLRLYEAGYKVAFTPYIQAPAEAVSTVKRLIRQRMRWAEGASFNVKVMLGRMLWGHWESKNDVILGNEVTPESDSGQARMTTGQARVWVPSRLTLAEKLEFAYLALYYLQAAFFVVGTLSWFLSEAVFGARLPFWTAALGWSLVFTNLLSLPLMNMIGLFLEESDERDYAGIISFVILSYILVPFQAYAAVKGFLEKEEGPWFRTPKTGAITDVVKRMGTFHLRLWPFGRAPIEPTGADFADLDKSAFNNFSFSSGSSYRGGRFRLVPRTVLAILLILTLSMNFFVISVPETYATNQGADFGLWTDIYCLSSTDCKISYRDASNLDLRMADCDNATCSSGGDRAVDEGGDVGDLQTSIYCPATNDCKIAYLDATNGNLKMADCNNETCDSATLTTVDPAAAIVGRFPSIYCPATDDCKIAYYDADNGDLRFADCGNATCSSVTLTLLDGRTGCTLTGCSTTSIVGRDTSIYCVETSPGANDASSNCKISYWDTTNENLMMADCDAVDCSSGVATTVDTAPTISDESIGMTSIYCLSSTDCKIAYYDFTNPPRDLKMVDCNDSACTAGNRTITAVDTTGDRGRYASIYCPATDDCKIAYRNATDTDLYMVDCGGTDGTCATNTITAVDAGGDRGYYTSIYCISSTDCKISYYGTSTADLMFADCDDSACTVGNRTTGSVSLTVPEYLGLLIPVAPFLPKIVRKVRDRLKKLRKAKSVGKPKKGNKARPNQPKSA